MLNPKAEEIFVDGKKYAITWQDYGPFIRMNIFKDERRIAFRDLPFLCDRGPLTIQYLIRRTVGGCGDIRQSISK